MIAGVGLFLAGCMIGVAITACVAAKGERMMNSEGYRDETAEKAIHNASKKPQTPEHIMQVIRMMKAVAGVAHLEVVGRICLRDRESGKEYR